jgi:hypothetical protein
MNLRKRTYKTPQQNSEHWILGLIMYVCVVLVE